MLDVIVEERSAAVALRRIIPAVVPGWVEDEDFSLIEFSGKNDLLKNLPARLRAYRRWIGGPNLLVLVDRDQQDCLVLKAELEAMAAAADLVTKTSGGPHFRVVNRIAVEELEAWFLGDAVAIRSAYPRVSSSFERKVAFRDPDAVKGGTAEALERLLKVAGYFEKLPKVAAAEAIAAYMDPGRNRSTSFGAFCVGLRESAAQP